MINAISAVFPKRPLVLKEASGKFSPFTSALILIVLLGGIGITTILMSWFSLLPDLRQDWVIAQDAEEFDPSAQFAAPFRSGSAITGECTTRGRVLQDCNVRISYRDSKGSARTRNLSMAFLDFSFSGYEVNAVRSASSPDLVSVDLAVKHIGNRIAVLILMILFGIGMIAVGPFLLSKNKKTRKNIQSLSGQILAPVEVNITSQITTYGATNIGYTLSSGSGIKKFNVNFGKQKPFLLSLNGTQAMGLTAPGQEYVFLVDEALSRVDMSDAERQAVRQARDEALQGKV